jgi:hypothetical protein
MRRTVAAAAAVAATAFATSGCGTTINLLDADRDGRVAYGGVARDIAAFTHPLLAWPFPDEALRGRGALGGLAVDGAVTLAFLGLTVADAPLSLVGDTCTLPIIPWLNRLDSPTKAVMPTRTLERSIEPPIQQPAVNLNDFSAEAHTAGHNEGAPIDFGGLSLVKPSRTPDPRRDAMPTVTIQFEYTTDAERLALEQALAFVLQLRQVADTAPVGQVLAACEQVALRDGRALLRDTLAAAVQRRVAQAEQKGGPPAPAPARTPPATRASTAARP